MAQINVTCAHCARLNRVPADRMNQLPVCGACKQTLLSAVPVVAKSADWPKYMKQDLPVVVDFWASWCGPCQMMAPVFNQAAQLWEGKAFFVKAETEVVQDIAARYAVRSIPTLLILHHGIEVARVAGAMPAPQFSQWLQQTLPKVSAAV
ncbi:MAG: thioredoxin TrxC [Natronospirillum sp.]